MSDSDVMVTCWRCRHTRKRGYMKMPEFKWECRSREQCDKRIKANKKANSSET